MSKNRTTLRQFLLRKIHPVDIAKSLDRIIFSPFFQKKIFLWIVTIALSLVFFIPTIPSYRSWDVDSPSYYMAGRGILQHVNIYDDQQFQQLADDVLGKSRVVLPYIYWPFLAQLFTPLSFFSISDFFVILQIFNTLLTFLGLVLVYDLLGFKESKTNFLFMFLFLLLIGNVPLRTTIDFGQVNILVLDLILLSLILLKKNRSYLSSLLLCLAVLIKVYPVLFLFVFLFYKKYKYLVYTALNGLGILLLSIFLFGKTIWIEYVKSGLETFSGTKRSLFTLNYIANINNNSLKSFLLQLFPSGSPAVQSILSLLTPMLLMGFLLFFLKAKKSLLRDHFSFGVSVILMSSLFISPMTWRHHYVIMLFPLAYLMSRIVREKRYGYFIPYCLFSALILYPELWGGFPFNQLRLISTAAFFFLLLHFGRKTEKEAYAWRL